MWSNRQQKMLLNPKYDCFQWDTTKLSAEVIWSITWTVCIIQGPEASDSTLCIKMNMKCSELELSWSSPSCVCFLSHCEIKTTVVRDWSRSAASSHLIPSCSDASEYSRYLPFWLRLRGLRRTGCCGDPAAVEKLFVSQRSDTSLSCSRANRYSTHSICFQPVSASRLARMLAGQPGQAGPGWAGPPSPSVTTALVPGRVSPAEEVACSQGRRVNDSILLQHVKTKDQTKPNSDNIKSSRSVKTK